MKRFGFIFAVVFSLSLFLTLTPAHAIPQFSVSLRPSETSKKYFEQAEDTGTVTASLTVYNAIVLLLKDNDGDEYYPKITVRIDLDATQKTNYSVVSYLNFKGGSGYGYDWFIIDESDVFTLEEGYSPEEGIVDLDLEFISGYGRMKIDVKFEIYYEDGGDDYDTKGDPFAPSPTPTPTPCEPENVSVNPNTLKLDNKTSEDVTVTVTGANGCAVEGEAVTAAVNSAGKKRIYISPTNAVTDASGQAIFTITAKKTGSARVTFQANSLRESISVKVK